MEGGAFRVWTRVSFQWFLQVCTTSSSSQCNSVREGSGFFQDDLIPGSEIIHLQLHHCSLGQQDKLVNEPITSSSERYFLLLW